MKTNWQDPGSGEILSTYISGLQEAVGKIEDTLQPSITSVANVTLEEIPIYEGDRYRIYQSPGKRNWVASPAPIIKVNEVVKDSGYTIEYGGGGVVFNPPLSAGDVVTADFSYVAGGSGALNSKETPAGAQAKADTAESNAKAHADAKASTAESNAKSYADTVGASAITSANSYTDQEVATINQALAAHLAEKATETDYGHIRLSDIPKQEIATKSEAESGESNTKLMTPLRTAQAIDNKLRVVDGIAEININGEWVAFISSQLNSWEQVQQIVRAGLASDYFEIGDQFASLYGYGAIVWEVIGIDIDTPSDNHLTHSLTIQTRDVVENREWWGGSERSNRYINSPIREYLNGEFLDKLDPDLASVLGVVNKSVERYPSGRDSFSDKVFLLSKTEVGLGGSGTTGDTVYPYYNEVNDSHRIKRYNGSITRWWLRSPGINFDTRVDIVDNYGDLDPTYNADNSYGIAPACVIV